jgi:hypothetical protein
VYVTARRDGTMWASPTHIEPMMKKQPLEFFKADSWRVRLTVLLIDRLTYPALLVAALRILMKGLHWPLT